MAGRRGGRPITWSGSYGLRRERAFMDRLEKACPQCGHAEGDHREYPSTWKLDEATSEVAEVRDERYRPGLFRCWHADGCECELDLSA